MRHIRHDAQQPNPDDHRISRRNLLRGAGLIGGTALTGAALNACGIGGPPAAPNGASAVTGSFDWKKAAGSTIHILEEPHPYQKSYLPLLKDFYATFLTAAAIAGPRMGETERDYQKRTSDASADLSQRCNRIKIEE